MNKGLEIPRVYMIDKEKITSEVLTNEASGKKERFYEKAFSDKNMSADRRAAVVYRGPQI